MSDSGPEVLTLMVQTRNSHDTMSGGAQPEHWRSSMEMKNRDDDDEMSFA